MTCREKLALEHPDRVSKIYTGGCCACPHTYNYLPKPDFCPGNYTYLPNSEFYHVAQKECMDCWDREIAGSGNTSEEKALKEIRDLIDDAMKKGDRRICLYFSPESGISVNIYPYPDFDDLFEQYEKGRISANDFREKMGLSPIRE